MSLEDIKVSVERIIKEHLEVEEITEVNLEALGINSIDALELLIELENEFDIEIPDEDLNVELFSSIDSLSEYIGNAINE